MPDRLESVCCSVGPALDPSTISSIEAGRRSGKAERRRFQELVLAEALQPATEGDLASAARILGCGGPDQISGEVQIAGGDRMRDGMVDVPLTGIPAAGAGVQFGFLLHAEPVQLRFEHLTQQGVVAVLAIAMVERNQEQVRAGKAPQDLGGALPSENRVTELAG